MATDLENWWGVDQVIHIHIFIKRLVNRLDALWGKLNYNRRIKF